MEVQEIIVNLELCKPAQIIMQEAHLLIVKLEQELHAQITREEEDAKLEQLQHAQTMRQEAVAKPERLLHQPAQIIMQEAHLLIVKLEPVLLIVVLAEEHFLELYAFLDLIIVNFIMQLQQTQTDCSC